MPETIKTVAIPGVAWEIAADLYFPPNFNPKGKLKYPAVISAHPIGSCKEQTASNIYGKALAKAGFVVVAFDASFQGASGGTPRFIENPEFRVSDFRYVVDYIQKSLTYVDAERIGVLGICGGGAYALHAAMTDYRLKCSVGVTPANFGRLAREAFAEFNLAGALEKMAAQRKAEARGADHFVVNYLPFASAEETKGPPRDARCHTSQLPRAIAAHIPYQSVCDMWEIRSYRGDVVGGILQVRVDSLGSGGVFVSRRVSSGPSSRCLQQDVGR
jgi:fermentation-respiration switch protein FrsA (DUF1100 family)